MKILCLKNVDSISTKGKEYEIEIKFYEDLRISDLNIIKDDSGENTTIVRIVAVSCDEITNNSWNMNEGFVEHFKFV